MSYDLEYELYKNEAFKEWLIEVRRALINFQCVANSIIILFYILIMAFDIGEFFYANYDCEKCVLYERYGYSAPNVEFIVLSSIFFNLFTALIFSIYMPLKFKYKFNYYIYLFMKPFYNLKGFIKWLILIIFGIYGGILLPLAAFYEPNPSRFLRVYFVLYHNEIAFFSFL